MLKPNLRISFFKRKIHSFYFFGIFGFVIGMLLGIVLCWFLHVLIFPILVMGFTGAATFFVLAFLVKRVTGKDTIVYYHHEIAILVICAILLKVLGLPVLAYLDITILGIATFLAFGRIGCFSVGCCHGRPVKKGIIYGQEHVKAGFTYYYEGVPLLPVQLIESAFVFFIIITGIFLLLQHFPPGTVLIQYTVLYGAFRFALEFLRGDAERPYFKGLSEAQWTTLLLIGISIIMAFSGFVPLYTWHILISILLFITGSVIVIRDSLSNKISSPRHIWQIAMALSEFNNEKNEADFSQKQLTVYKTQLGLNLSIGQLINEGKPINHYTISCKKGNQITYHLIKKLAGVIKQLQKHTGLYEISENNNQIFHIIFKD